MSKKPEPPVGAKMGASEGFGLPLTYPVYASLPCTTYAENVKFCEVAARVVLSKT
jgi:hypothetical protein